MLVHLMCPIGLWKGESESHSVESDSLRPHGIYSPWNSPGQNTGVGSLSLLQGTFPRSPTLWADSLPAEPQRKPKNTGVGIPSIPIPSPMDLPKLGIKPGSPALQADSLPTELSRKPKLSLSFIKYQHIKGAERT